MKKGKAVIGALLIICAAAGLIFWETRGREAVTTDQVLVAAQRIEAGSRVSRELFDQAPVPAKNRIEGGLAAEDYSVLEGLTAVQTIEKNGQISPAYFAKDEFCFNDGEAVYVIPKEWISMRSSSLRRGDRVTIYTEDGSSEIGRYRIAFVKDSAEREVKEAGDGEGAKTSRILERTDSTSEISHVEIISDMDGFQRVKQAAEMGQIPGQEIVPRLLIVQCTQESIDGKDRSGKGGEVEQ